MLSVKQMKSEELQNPVLGLSNEAFHSLLTLVVSSAKAFDSSLRTKTSIQITKWLDVLNGNFSIEEYITRYGGNMFWDMKAMQELRLDPIIICLYERIKIDSAKMVKTI